MFRSCCAAIAFVVTVSLSIVVQAQDDKPAIELTPNVVVQDQLDEGTLVDKVSFFMGFNLIDGIKRQGGKVETDKLIEGMKAAQSGPDISSFVAGFQLMSQLKGQKDDINIEQLIKGLKAAQEGADKKDFVSGYTLMTNLKEQGADLKLDKLAEGMQTASAEKELGMSEEEVGALMASYQKLIENQQIEKMKKAAADNLAEGKAYMAKVLAENPNAKELDGIVYEVLKEGDGPSPTAEDTVKVDYHGMFIDGSVFDSSVAPPSGDAPSPTELSVSAFVAGFSKALQNMKVGSKWRVIIPGNLAYGASGRGKIGPNQTLVFEVTLLEIIK